MKKEAAQAGDKVRKWLDGIEQGDITPADSSSGASSAFSDASSTAPSGTSSNTSSGVSSSASSGVSSASADIFKALEWRYPFGRLSSIHAKISVTELKRRFSQEEETGAAASVQQLVAKPLFMETEQGVSAARKGTLMHFVMQHLDLDKLRKAGNEGNVVRTGDAFTDEIKAQLDIMTAKELLTEEEAKAMAIKAVVDENTKTVRFKGTQGEAAIVEHKKFLPRPQDVEMDIELVYIPFWVVRSHKGYMEINAYDGKPTKMPIDDGAEIL
jgi:ATP-dependent exoDNAse (exonuclease V) beta subunit